MARCFKCEKKINCAITSKKTKDIWKMPCDAVLFTGDNFGSSIYNTAAYIEIIVCDKCLITAKNTDRLREKRSQRLM